MPRKRSHPVAMLWEMAFDDARLSCAVYKAAPGLEMRLETATRTILSEPFELRPRMLARVRALRRSLARRGWRDVAG